jgi:hypothetical protein
LEFPEHDGVLAHTYYELKIRKSGKKIITKWNIPVTVILEMKKINWKILI